MAYSNKKSDRQDRMETGVRRRSAPAKTELIDYNDVDVLRRYVTEYGKIIPARITGVTAHQQRQIKKGVRRARNMGLMA
jgi:small subunit ribosomal protein S18